MEAVSKVAAADSDLPLKFLVPLLHCKKYSIVLKVSFVSKLAEYSMKKLIPIILALRKRMGGRLSDELEDLLNPELLEKNVGKDLRNNIEKVLDRKIASFCDTATNL